MSTLFAMTPSSRRFPMQGMLAGAIGGLLGAWFKLGWEVIWPPRALDRIPEPAVLITMFTHIPTPDWAGFIVHFSFSILSGVAYGALVEFFPIVALWMGVGMGLGIWIIFHLIVMPWIGLTPPTWQLPLNENGSEFFGHIGWGLVIGVFYEDFRRRFVKPAASPKPVEALVGAPLGATLLPGNQ